jgi:hypothetical protein
MMVPAEADRSADSKLLAQRFVETQGIDEGDAAKVADKIATADQDIWNSALAWAKHGELPAEPEVEGYTPKLLGEKYSPSVAFTALMGLRTEPERTLSALRHSLAGLPPKSSR